MPADCARKFRTINGSMFNLLNCLRACVRMFLVNRVKKNKAGKVGWGTIVPMLLDWAAGKVVCVFDACPYWGRFGIGPGGQGPKLVLEHVFTG